MTTKTCVTTQIYQVSEVSFSFVEKPFRAYNRFKIYENDKARVNIDYLVFK